MVVDTTVSEDRVKDMVENEWRELSERVSLLLQKNTENTRSEIEEFEGVYEKKYLRLVQEVGEVEKAISKVEVAHSLSQKHLEN